MTPTARSARYQIRLQGHLEERWYRWFEDLVIDQTCEDETLINGSMDQAALHGVLNRIRDLGIEILSVQRIDSENELSADGSQSFPPEMMKEKKQQ